MPHEKHSSVIPPFLQPESQTTREAMTEMSATDRVRQLFAEQQQQAKLGGSGQTKD